MPSRAPRADQQRKKAARSIPLASELTLVGQLYGPTEEQTSQVVHDATATGIAVNSPQLQVEFG